MTSLPSLVHCFFARSTLCSLFLFYRYLFLVVNENIFKQENQSPRQGGFETTISVTPVGYFTHGATRTLKESCPGTPFFETPGNISGLVYELPVDYFDRLVSSHVLRYMQQGVK